MLKKRLFEAMYDKAALPYIAMTAVMVATRIIDRQLKIPYTRQ